MGGAICLFVNVLNAQTIAVIDAGAPSNVSNCQLLLNYYNHKPIGVWGPMTCVKDVTIGGPTSDNGLVIQNTGLETLQENKTDNINAIALKISHSGTDRWVVKGDGSLSITPYNTDTFHQSPEHRRQRFFGLR